ncbi:AAA family ATPase [Flammeovirga kamogawensis]|uniref:AAA family ATPase n=1 Tax=Flammeovirga kamogawensis TaxID=373891 RepID=A0ABX8GSK7_9BACT|nr:AAA family ATPase [Flammeovirga kamogawensis]MBB6463220.1 MoxR-like ATPase [Flammeovirga kamogawensis]QWG05930.1 AAA family ATPase [Flammeovirga kamogawensis]TRX67755.1 ATPase [Flammeovirga kamogawensis]
MTEISSIASEVRKRSKKLLKLLGEDLHEKEDVLSLALLSAIAGESIFMLGPPGVGKSMIARRLKYAFKGGDSFEYLMNRFSTPDEIFGPISISKLSKEDKYERLTDNYLPGSSVVFLDEIWKAGPSIQNALLTVLNEKVFRNGEQEIEVKVHALLSASNELPAKGEGLEAIWDRFLVRVFVDRIIDEQKFFDMITSSKLTNPVVSEDVKFDEEEVDDWSTVIDQVKIPQEVLSVISIVRKYIERYNQSTGTEVEKNIYVSDRRWHKIVRLLRTSAFMNGRSKVDLSDCFLISNCIWNSPDQIDMVRQWVTRSVQKYGWSAKYSMDTVKAQLDNYAQIVEEKTKVEKELLVEAPHLIDGEYYQIDGFSSLNNRILADDFEMLGRGASDVMLYTSTGRTEPFTVGRISDTEIEVRLDFEYHKYKLKSTKEHKVGKVSVQVTDDIKSNLNREADQLLNYLDKISHEIEEMRHSREEGVGKNIFLSENWRSLIDESLNDLWKQVLNYKLQTEKLKRSYGG